MPIQMQSEPLKLNDIFVRFGLAAKRHRQGKEVEMDYQEASQPLTATVGSGIFMSFVEKYRKKQAYTSNATT